MENLNLILDQLSHHLANLTEQVQRLNDMIEEQVRRERDAEREEND